MVCNGLRELSLGILHCNLYLCVRWERCVSSDNGKMIRLFPIASCITTRGSEEETNMGRKVCRNPDCCATGDRVNRVGYCSYRCEPAFKKERDKRTLSFVREFVRTMKARGYNRSEVIDMIDRVDAENNSQTRAQLNVALDNS
jgi:hypothetical protein